jgi:hypothetical protein
VAEPITFTFPNFFDKVEATFERNEFGEWWGRVGDARQVVSTPALIGALDHIEGLQTEIANLKSALVAEGHREDCPVVEGASMDCVPNGGCTARTTKQTYGAGEGLRYLVYVDERGNHFPQARFDSWFHATQFARRLVDDALPSNSVFVVDTTKNMQIGYAYLAGDGSDAFEKTPDTPSQYKGPYVPPKSDE